MQDLRCDSSSSSKSQRGGLPPLAPRNSRPTARGDRTSSGTSSGRPGRLSHRSRAGCWTCRGRKVKCDEVHPRCGPCTRLNRDCDWDHRWNFNDATPITQNKFANVITSGNAVWDPTARRRNSSSPISRQHDDLPDFAALTSDEDRERKAETQRPGYYGVVVTPESFHDLPEYATGTSFGSRWASGASVTSGRGGYRRERPSFGRLNTALPDPNIVVLERFEEASPTSAGPYSISGDSRRGSVPETSLSQLTITTPPNASNAGTAPQTPVLRSDDHHLILHFRQYIVPRLVQPRQESIPGLISQSSTRNIFEQEALHFRPLYHAICAISALHLAYTGRAKLEDAMQHYHQALAASSTTTSPNDLLSDGVFLRHFLMFIFDICIPMQSGEEGSTDMWAQHLNSLRRLSIQRNDSDGSYAYTLWSICELDMYACLMGSGSCEFVRTIMQHNMLPLPEQQIPPLSIGGNWFLPYEAAIFPTILHLNQGVVLRTAKIAQTAQSFRSEITSSPRARARWQATATQLQNDLNTFWHNNYPATQLGPESPSAGLTLPERVRSVFENALLLYHAATLYARASMFSLQRTIPTATSNLPDTERRVTTILTLATQNLEAGHYDRRNIIFPIFMAGIATTSGESKLRALDLVRAFEGKGIGQNTYRCRLLLSAVVEEQRRRGGVESVDWWVVARERGLGVINCGL